MVNIEYKTTYKHFIIYFLSLLIIVDILVFSTFLYIENSLFEIRKADFINSETNVLLLESSLIGKEIDYIVSDLLFLKSNLLLHINDKENMDLMIQDWMSFSKNRKVYDQIRYIDANGDEKIRINYSDTEVTLVGSADLQNKKDRHYFTETIKLEKNQIYLSKLDLNVENSEIESPIKPMIRFCVPVYNIDNIVEGIVVINFKAQGILDEFREIAKNSKGEVFLLDSDGYYLDSNDEDHEWGFMYSGKADIKFDKHFPLEGERVYQESNAFITANGLFISSDVVLVDKLSVNKTLIANENIIWGDGNWRIVSFNSIDGANKGAIADKFSDKFSRIFNDNYPYFIWLTLLSLLIALFIYFNRRARERVKFYSEYDPLTVTYNRRAGLEEINKLLPNETRRRSRVSICFIDVNGLKQVNDFIGHEAGDELILTVVNGIKEMIRDTDFIIRMGGDEFLIVFSNTTMGDAELVWDRIKAAFVKINEEESRAYNISASHGIVEFDDYEDRNIDELIKFADEKMYIEKKKVKKDFKSIDI